MAEKDKPKQENDKHKEEEDEDEDEGSAMLLASVTKDEWKAIEGALLPNRKAVCEMLTRVSTQIRVGVEKPPDGKKAERGEKEAKKDVVFDENIGRFLVDMLPEMDGFAEWIYANHIRPKLESMALDLPAEEGSASDGKEDKKGGAKKGGGGGKKDKPAKEVKIPAKVQIKLDNIVRIMQGESANTTKMAGKRGNLGDRSVGWLEGLQSERPLANDAPWELQLAREMANAGLLLRASKDGKEKEVSKSVGFAAIRNLSDAIMTYEAQFKIRFDEGALKKVMGSRLLTDARHVLAKLKDAVAFEADECLRSHAHLLSSSDFRKRHAAKFLQPYPTQLQLFRQLLKPGPQLVLLRSPPDTGKTSVAPTLAELFPDERVVFCCLARRVNLEIAQILYNQGAHAAACARAPLCAPPLTRARPNCAAPSARRHPVRVGAQQHDHLLVAVRAARREHVLIYRADGAEAAGRRRAAGGEQAAHAQAQGAPAPPPAAHVRHRRDVRLVAAQAAGPGVDGADAR